MSGNKSPNFDSITEDTIQCFFFSSLSYTNWEHLCNLINETIDALSLDYIWHRDEFKVHLPHFNNQSDDFTPHLFSTTCFGDNIEDEWFIVYLLLEITKQFKNVVVQLKDNDGDFILIEAADYLPSWANPENTENRVFIYNNQIHIIPPTVANISSKLKLNDAIRTVVQSPEQTRAASEIHKAILKRIGNYPEKTKENLHRVIIKLPLDVATLLTLKPSLIAPIVNRYCNHDIIDIKSCRNVSFNNCVNVEVKFTKFLYAMLMNSKPIKSISYANKVPVNDKKSIIGLKLTCGFQMIVNELSKDIFCSKEYVNFLNSLKGNGYFKDNIEGSKDHTQLLQQAQNFFLNMKCPIYSDVSNNISQLMQTDEFTKLKEVLTHKHESEFNYIEDNEDWLKIHPEQLNNLLNSRYGKQIRFNKYDDELTAQTISSELSNFLKQTSDFEGIETNAMEGSINESIEFDSEEFVNTLQKMLNAVTTEDHGDIDGYSDSSEDVEDDDINIDLSGKLQSKLHNSEDNKNVLSNIIQSMREEEGSSGPSSNLLRSIGINKTELLDSDDD